MKKCYRCSQDLPFDMFGKNKSKPNGHSTECKKCKSAMDKVYQDQHKEEIKDKKQQYYLGKKYEIIKKVNEYIDKNRHKHNLWHTVSKNRLKAEVMTNYSGGNLKCKNCPEVDLGILTIDHIEGNGADHRRELFGDNRKGGGYKFWQWLKRNNYPEGFQVLCFNCQFRKRAVELKPENPTHLQEVRAKYARSIKIECLQNYGGLKCSCGEEDIVTLTLDHVNDDGSEHRRQTNTKGNNFYHMLRKCGFPQDPPLQVLCLNCQIKKRNKKYSEVKSA